MNAFIHLTKFWYQHQNGTNNTWYQDTGTRINDYTFKAKAGTNRKADTDVRLVLTLGGTNLRLVPTLGSTNLKLVPTEGWYQFQVCTNF